ncbi:hypothetical protein [Salinibacter ruber]|uniref:hypothetical protein n=1 Tax=Salinibacter ruber TaxID=146919 RepID=UPI002169E4BB|nr:hypothetical protein [Salinibacter ruber]MCS3698259.1 hypothetical protein [Salinibacter ruber]
MQYISIRLVSIALFGAAAIMVSGCDSNGGSPNNSVVTDSMQIANVTPDVGADLESTDASITVTFTDPVVENEYTRTDVEATSGNRHLIDVIGVYPDRAKDLSPNGSLPISLSFNDNRTQLTITPERGLQDGFIYTLDVGDIENSNGVYDPRFKSEDGARFAPNPNFPPEEFGFSVGLSEEPPAVPSVSFDSESTVVTDGRIENETFNYEDRSVTVPLQVNGIDDSAAEVKGYEVYYRSQEQVGRFGNDDQFTKASEVRPQASPSDFEDASGIVPARAVEADGDLDFTAEVGGYPFAGDGGAYGPIEWKVRAVSINNVRGDFSDVMTTGDNTRPGLEFISYYRYDDTGDVERIGIEFSEALDGETVSPRAFRITDDNGSSVPLSATSLENAEPGGRDDTTVEVTLANPVPQRDLRNVVVNDAGTSRPVTDLAGNGVDLSTARAPIR